MPLLPTPPRQRRPRGQGSLYRDRRGRWCVQAPPGPDGRRPIQRFGRDEAAARAAYARLTQPPEPGVLGLGTAETTLAIYLARWYEQARPHLAPQSQRHYRQRLAYAAPLARVPLGQLRPDQFASLWAELLQRGSRRPGHERLPLAPLTVTAIKAVLHRALEDAVSYGLLAVNPVHPLRIGSKRQPETRHWTPEQADRFLRTARGSRLEPLWFLGLHCGLRLGECLGLRWTDLDLEHGLVTVRTAVTGTRAKPGRPKEREVEEGPTKGRRIRVLPLSPQTMIALERYRAAQPALARAGWVFANPQTGRPWSGAVVRQEARWLCAYARVPRLPQPVHGLRHTFSAIQLAEDGNLTTLSQALGHASPTVTLRSYAHSLPGALDQVARIAARRMPGMDEDEANHVV